MTCPVRFTRSSMYSVLPPALKAFHQAYPQVAFKLFEMLTDEQTDALRDMHPCRHRAAAARRAR